MSGGRWDYQDYRIHDIADTFDDTIENNNVKPEYYWGEWNGQLYPDEVIDEFKKGYAILKLAEVYSHRADWLLSDDDGDESFIRRLKSDIDELAEIDKHGYIKKILESLKN